MSATRGLYQIADGTFVRTQAEIPKGQPTEKVEVPVGSQELCDFLNTLIAYERSQAKMTPTDLLVGHPDEPETQPEAAPPPPPPAAPDTEAVASQKRQLAQALRGMEVEAIEERILDMKGPAFGRIMAASVERMGALGKDGWQALRGHLDLFTMPTNYDRGLLALSLGQIERLDEPKRAPQTYKEINPG